MKLQHNPTYANVPTRITASLIDWQIASLFSLYPLSILLGIQTLSSLVPASLTMVASIWLPVSLMYPLILILFITTTGYTPGKFVTGIQIAAPDHSLLSFLRVTFRELIAKPVSAAILCIGFFAIAVDPNHQAWHDHLSNTYVYQIGHRTAIGVLVVILLGIGQFLMITHIIAAAKANLSIQADIQFLFEPLVHLFR